VLVCPTSPPNRSKMILLTKKRSTRTKTKTLCGKIWEMFNLQKLSWSKHQGLQVRNILIINFFSHHVFISNYTNEESVALYRFTTPVLSIRDPEQTKDLIVKTFIHFTPFCLKNEEWKVIRAQPTSRKVSQLKSRWLLFPMKWLYPLLEDVCTKLARFIDSRPEITYGEGYEANEQGTGNAIIFILHNAASCAREGKYFKKKN
jgi:hypothetical protein